MEWLLALAVLWSGVLAVDHCPQHCYCYQDPDRFLAANCSSQALSDTAVSAIELLALQPHVRSVPTPFFPRAFTAFPKVKFLSAVNCSIIHIPSDVFHGLNYVIEIDLSFNKIRHLNGPVFKDLGSLHTLILRGNPLYLTNWDAIVSNSLRKLDMGRCGLKKIPAGTFVNAASLTHLILDGNDLHTLVHNEVPTGLRYLNLAHNKITNVPTEVFNSMIYLRKLDLSRNPINCTCSLLVLQDWFSGQGVSFENDVICSEPPQYTGQRLSIINENELCKLEDIIRQRHINDIQHYSDIKAHRKHNMIQQDQGFQGDQPYMSHELAAEVMFVNDGLHGITHMEMSGRHRDPVPDVSVESNKLENSKQELSSAETEHAISPPSKEQDVAGGHISERKETESSEYVTHLNKAKPSQQINSSAQLKNDHGDIMLSDMEDGSGLSPTEDLLHSTSSKVSEDLKEISADSMPTLEEKTTSKTSSVSSTASDGAYYNYDSQHDYSGEVTARTESVKTILETDEGSGESENSSPSRESITIRWMEEQENETTTELLLTIDNSTDLLFNGTHGSNHDDLIAVSTEPSSENVTVISIVSSSETSINLEGSGQTSAETSTEGLYSDFPLSSTEDNVSPSIAAGLTDGVIKSSSTTEFVELSSSADASTTPTESTLTFSSSVSPIDIESETTTEAHMTPLIEPGTSRSSSPSSSTEPIEDVILESTSPTVAPTILGSTSLADVEIINERTQEVHGRIRVASTLGELGGAERADDAKESILSYVIIGLLLVLVVIIMTTLVCKRTWGRKKKVRLPRDTETNLGTEMQDMLLPKPPENGVKIAPQNGTSNGKEVKEEEVPVLSKDWEEKSEPIETVTARMSILARPQTPVFIHKTLA